jgi:molybdopterin-guanine dinucleotide biosynthesis protein A
LFQIQFKHFPGLESNLPAIPIMTQPANQPQPYDDIPALILCGGRSRRMGKDKARLPLGSATVLQNVQKTFASLSNTTVLVIGHDSADPENHQFDSVVRDQRADLGPLEGLRVGMECLTASELVLVGTCDAPLVVPVVYRRMVERARENGCDAVVPAIDGQTYPLTAVYRTRVLDKISEMVARGQLRVKDLLEAIDVCQFGVDEFRDVDPEFQTIRNINTWEEYQELLRDLNP